MLKSNSRKSIIQVEELTKRFNEVTAVNEISFEIWEGELFGFLGPNGAGKTTTINMLTGLARSDAGRIQIADVESTQNPKRVQHFIGVVPDESNLYPELTGFDNLCFCASLYGLKKDARESRAKDLLTTFGLKEAAHRKFVGYSRGMKRKLTIAAGIIHQPSILFLDEPTTGIDVASARQIRQLIADLHRSGTTIFLTTHYIEEAERLCERIAFIVEGRIVKIDTVGNLLQSVRGRHVMQVSVSKSSRIIYRTLKSTFPDFTIQLISDDLIRIEAKEPISIGPLVRTIEKQGAEVTEARRIRPTLEKVFVEVTGIELDMMKKEKEKSGNNQ